MGRIEKFYGTEEVVKVNGEDFKVPALTVKQMPLLLGAYKGDAIHPEGMKKLVDFYLGLNFPEASLDERDKVSFQNLMPVMEAIGRVNGIQGDERLQKIKQKVAERAERE